MDQSLEDVMSLTPQDLGAPFDNWWMELYLVKGWASLSLEIGKNSRDKKKSDVPWMTKENRLK